MNTIVTSSRWRATKTSRVRIAGQNRAAASRLLHLNPAQDRSEIGKQHRVGQQRHRRTDQLDQHAGCGQGRQLRPTMMPAHSSRALQPAARARRPA